MDVRPATERPSQLCISLSMEKASCNRTCAARLALQCGRNHHMRSIAVVFSSNMFATLSLLSRQARRAIDSATPGPTSSPQCACASLARQATVSFHKSHRNDAQPTRASHLNTRNDRETLLSCSASNPQSMNVNAAGTACARGLPRCTINSFRWRDGQERRVKG